MKGVTLWGGMALLVWSSTASAQGLRGSELLAYCNAPSDNAFAHGICLGYIAGAIDDARFAAYSLKTCYFDPPRDMSKGDIAKSVQRYLGENQDRLENDAASLVFGAMQAAYPCK